MAAKSANRGKVSSHKSIQFPKGILVQISTESGQNHKIEEIYPKVDQLQCSLIHSRRFHLGLVRRVINCSTFPNGKLVSVVNERCPDTV